MKKNEFEIFSENKNNIKSIESLYNNVFGEDRVQRNVYHLRTGRKVNELCFVIKNTDVDVYACIRYWLIQIGLVKGLLLGPLAVRKDMQGYGLGSMLINHSIKIAKSRKYKFCFVSGEADYYPKFGLKKIDVKKLILPGYIDPKRLHIIFFKEGIENEMGNKPWHVISSN